jgi:hypothetical protein
MQISNASLLALFIWSPFYVLPTGLGCFVIWRFFSSRPSFTIADWSLLFMPWFVWFSAMLVTPQQKSLANLAEVYVLILVALVGFLVRIQFGEKFGARLASFVVLGVACLAGVMLALFIPALPE